MGDGVADGMYDFLVIGAIKSGTTTLHYLMVDHPELSLPVEKEVPLFDRDVSPSDVSAHVRRYTGATPARLSGKATPRYMRVPDAAARIHAAGPDTKLIALVRDPIQRARSHWRMRCQLGHEHRSFAQAVEDQLADTGRWRSTLVEQDSYVACGEYGRIFEEYRSHFPAEQLLVLETADLQRDPDAVLRRVWTFLGVADHTPASLGKQFNVAERASRHARIGRAVWKVVPYDLAIRYTGPRFQRRAGQLLDRLRIDRPAVKVDAGLPADLQRSLEEHYLADASRLPDRIDVDVWPWRSATQCTADNATQ